MSKADLSSKHAEDSLIEVGVLGRPHGIRGGVRFFPYNVKSKIWTDLDRIVVRTINSSEMILDIQNIGFGSKHFILELKGITGRNSAERLKGAIVLVPRDVLPMIDDDEFYVEDLLNVHVWCNGSHLGEVVSSREQGGVEVVTVSDGVEEFEIPLVDQYVVNLDVDNGRLEVRDVGDLPRSRARGKG